MDHEFSESELEFSWPREIETLEDVPECFRGGYLAADAGGYVLAEEVAAEVEEGNRRFAEVEAEHKAQIADLDRQIAKHDAEIKDHVAGREIANALRDLGATPGLIEGATALLKQELDIEIEQVGEREYRASVAGPHGKTSAAHAVKIWAHTDGRAFLPQRHEPGPTSAAMAKLRGLLN